MNLIFASHNPNKLIEVQARLSAIHSIKGLTDIDWTEEIPETADTIRGNAILKVRAVFSATGRPCFADDTGLEIDTLQGRPGVYSARYAGPEKEAEANMAKVLDEMLMADNRGAQFKTCIALCITGEVYVFQGIVRGQISMYKRGQGGFGYDPIFVPEGFMRSFAEMSLDEKNTLSHRARAMDKLSHFLSKLT